VKQTAGGFNPLIPKDILSRCDKILFITHLAIGDFAYLQSCFRVFKKHHPNIKIDLWIDEVRRTRFFWDWKHLRNYSLIDWVSRSGLFNKIYHGSYSPGRLKKLSREAKSKNYPVVVSLCSLRKSWYCKLAKKISPCGAIAGVGDLEPREVAPGESPHISLIYQRWFEGFFGIKFLPDEQVPFISVPKEWLSYAKLRFIKWGIAPKGKRLEKTIFVNVFAKSSNRCWPLDKLVKLILSLQKTEKFSDANFIVNVEPRFYGAVKSFLSNYCLNRVFLFTAHENFFQLPAVLSLCDLVVSVETSVVHLASALKIPVVALMRKRNPEWGPFYKDNSKVVFTPTQAGWVEEILSSDVVDGVQEFESL
jgi:ADP-heptose:LPS heptosyltransferase